MYNYSESFMDYAYEGFGKKWTDKDRKDYYRMRKAQTSTPALRLSVVQAEHECKKRYKAASGTDGLEEFQDWLDKQINATQRSINGKEIKNKKILQKRQNVYLKWRERVSRELDL